VAGHADGADEVLCRHDFALFRADRPEIAFSSENSLQYARVELDVLAQIERQRRGEIA